MTVITPVFNGERYIQETVDSVLREIGQSDIEYLVVDDGSTDKTNEILESYGRKINVIHQPNQGESSAVNTGFKAAQGDFVLVVSADDPLFTSEIFEGVEAYFDSKPDLVAWYPDWRMIDPDSEIIREVLTQEYSDERLIGRFLCLPGPGTFIRKTAALEIKGRQTKWRFVGDYDFWLRLSRIGRIERRPAVLAQWRLHDESTSIAHRGLGMYTERIGVIREFLNANTIPKKIERMALGSSYYSAAILQFYCPEISGRKTLLKAFWYSKSIPANFNLKEFAYLFLHPWSRNLYLFLKHTRTKFLTWKRH
jgi:glycosyltransferase involved in cell wall biosynthesis